MPTDRPLCSTASPRCVGGAPLPDGRHPRKTRAAPPQRRTLVTLGLRWMPHRLRCEGNPPRQLTISRIKLLLSGTMRLTCHRIMEPWRLQNHFPLTIQRMRNIVRVSRYPISQKLARVGRVSRPNSFLMERSIGHIVSVVYQVSNNSSDVRLRL